jgi:hypothetical protein
MDGEHEQEGHRGHQERGGRVVDAEPAGRPVEQAGEGGEDHEPDADGAPQHGVLGAEAPRPEQVEHEDEHPRADEHEDEVGPPGHDVASGCRGARRRWLAALPRTSRRRR